MSTPWEKVLHQGQMSIGVPFSDVGGRGQDPICGPGST